MFPIKLKLYFLEKLGQKLGTYGITLTQACFLAEIGRHEDGISLVDISHMMNVSKALTTKVVKLLINRKYVNNVPKNGRTYSVTLTPFGEDVRSVIIGEYRQITDHILATTTDDEKKVIADVLTKVNVIIDKELRSAVGLRSGV